MTDQIGGADFKDSPFFFCASFKRQIFGIRIGRHYLSLAGPDRRPLFSERNRRGVKVLPLFGGWRIRLRSYAS